MALAAGDRVKVVPESSHDYFADGVFVDRRGWIVRTGYVGFSKPREALVLWDDDLTRSVVSTADLARIPPRVCQGCGREAYVGRGCLTGVWTEFVHDPEFGVLALVAGVGVMSDSTEALAQSRERRMLGASSVLGSMAVHWLRCRLAPKRIDPVQMERAGASATVPPVGAGRGRALRR